MIGPSTTAREQMYHVMIGPRISAREGNYPHMHIGLFVCAGREKSEETVYAINFVGKIGGKDSELL